MELADAGGGLSRPGKTGSRPRQPPKCWPKLRRAARRPGSRRLRTCPARSIAFAEVLHAHSGREVRQRRAADPRPGATRSRSPSRYRDRRTMLAEMTLDPPSSTQDLAGPPHPGRRLPRAQHDPLGQGAGMGRGLRDPRRRRQHPLRHGHRIARRDRGGTAAVLRRPHPGEGLALRLLPLALLLTTPAETATPTATPKLPASCPKTSSATSNKPSPTEPLPPPAHTLTSRAAKSAPKPRNYGNSIIVTGNVWSTSRHPSIQNEGGRVCPPENSHPSPFSRQSAARSHRRRLLGNRPA